MKNFARLARFAWPYRLRFALSLGCAAMVAVLFFGNLGAVYPLLKVLFHKDQNTQTWLNGEIRGLEAGVEVTAARLDEQARVRSLAAGPGGGVEPLRARYAELKRLQAGLMARVADEKTAQGGFGAPTPQVTAAAHELALADARLDELGRARNASKERDDTTLDARRLKLDQSRAAEKRWLLFYKGIAPWVARVLPRDPFATLLLLVGLVLAGVALKGVFMFCQEVLVANIVQLCLFDIRNLFFRRTMALDLASFTDGGTAELMARFTNDVDSLSQGLNTLLSKMIREPLRVVTCLGGALWINWRLTCLTLVLVPVSLMTTVRAGKIMKRAVRKSLESMSNIYKILQESFQGIKVVKAYTNERHERKRFYVETKALYRKSLRVATIDALSDPILEILSLLTVLIALMAGSYLVLRETIYLDLWLFKVQLAAHKMQIEELLALYTMLAGVSDPIRKLANVHSKLQRAAAASDRICALMDRRPSVADRPGAPRLPRHAAAIEFDEVAFSYTGRDPALRGVTLRVDHGETVALVGPNGCGKSTLMNLLPRFYEVGGGSIKVDGHDLRDIQLRSLRSQIGMVTQETVLFEGTMAENIAYGTRHATRDQVVVAARRAYAHGFIEAMPQGYDTPVGERGMSLSGGQRQRIALARVMLRDPSIVILDEATSAVDIQDELLIRKAIEEFARGRTVFLITHSLGSLQFADRIVLMNAGRVEAVGTDAELRRTSALYRRLNEIQYQRESA